MRTNIPTVDVRGLQAHRPSTKPVPLMVAVMWQSSPLGRLLSGSVIRNVGGQARWCSALADAAAGAWCGRMTPSMPGGTGEP